MSKDASPVSYRVNGADGMLGVVPTLLGFHPQESVVVTLAGPRHRVVLSTRVDVPAASHWDTRALTTVAGASERHGDEAVIAVYSDTHVDVTPLIEATETRGVQVITVVRTGNGDNELHSAAAAEAAIHGRRVLQTRQELAQSIAHHPDADPAEAAELLAELTTHADRDRYLAEKLRNKSLIPALIGAAQAVSDADPRVADLLVVTAIIAYRAGDGALAALALQRALAAQPHHQLGQLMDAVLTEGLHPTGLDRLATIE